MNGALGASLIAFPSGYLYWPTYEFPHRVEFDWFSYVFPTFAAIAAASAASPQQQITIQDDSAFELRRITYHADNAAAAFTSSTVPIGNLTALIVNSGSGRQLMNNPVPLDSIATPPGVTPMDLPWPKVFERNSVITLTLTNFDAAGTPAVRVVFHGRKIFSMV